MPSVSPRRTLRLTPFRARTIRNGRRSTISPSPRSSTKLRTSPSTSRSGGAATSIAQTVPTRSWWMQAVRWRSARRRIGRPDARAGVGAQAAARREGAAVRQIGQRRRAPLDRAQRHADGPAGRHRVEQASGVGVGRRPEESSRRRHLHEPPGIHHGHPIAGLGDDAQIVGHDHDRHAQPVAQLEQQLQDLVLDRDVERRRRLVGQQQPRPARQRDRDHHALAHAARELVRIVVEAARGGRHAHLLQQLDRPLAPRPPAEVGVRAQVLVDLAMHGEDGIEGRHRLLEDHADLAAAHGPPGRLVHRHEVAPEPGRDALDPPGRPDQPHDRPQRHALPGARLADEPQHLAGARARGRCRRRRSPRPAPWRSSPAGPGPRGSSPAAAHRRARRRSAMPSPSRLRPRPVRTMAMPGKMEIHQPVVMKFLPSAISTPHSAVGGWAPSPR